MHGIVYLDVDDEITSAAARIRGLEATAVALVLPYGSRLATSRINFRLLAREAVGQRAAGSSIVAPTRRRARCRLGRAAGLRSVAEFEAASTPGDGRRAAARVADAERTARPSASRGRDDRGRGAAAGTRGAAAGSGERRPPRARRSRRRGAVGKAADRGPAVSDERNDHRSDGSPAADSTGAVDGASATAAAVPRQSVPPRPRALGHGGRGRRRLGVRPRRRCASRSSAAAAPRTAPIAIAIAGVAVLAVVAAPSAGMCSCRRRRSRRRRARSRSARSR